MDVLCDSVTRDSVTLLGVDRSTYQRNGTPRAQPRRSLTAERENADLPCRDRLCCCPSSSLFFLFSISFLLFSSHNQQVGQANQARYFVKEYIFTLFMLTHYQFMLHAPTGSHQWRSGTVDPYTCPGQTLSGSKGAKLHRGQCHCY